jgi:tRNA G10  N-methylase Trm11
MSSPTHLFLLGRLPALSLRELEAVLQTQDFTKITENIVGVALADDQTAIDTFNFLGGSLKALKIQGEFIDVTDDQILEYATAFLAQFARPTFAIAELGRDKKPKIDAARIKRLLKEGNVSSRFIESPRDGLSASVLLHQKVTELNIIQVENKVIFAETLAVQDIDDWTLRDRRKPYSDRKKGMLPPKLARIMVNLGLGQAETGDSQAKPLVYDPFCGTGTVLLEAMMRDCDVVGSDLDPDSIMGTQNNLVWFDQTYQKKLNHQVFVADAANAELRQLPRKADLIVTEPFLGKQTPNIDQLPNIFKGLEKMYLGVFKQWTRLLAENATIVIVFPYVQAGKQTFSLENMIDKFTQLGYTATFSPILYSRPDAVVQRQIWVFKYSK